MIFQIWALKLYITLVALCGAAHAFSITTSTVRHMACSFGIFETLDRLKGFSDGAWTLLHRQYDVVFFCQDPKLCDGHTREWITMGHGCDGTNPVIVEGLRAMIDGGTLAFDAVVANDRNITRLEGPSGHLVRAGEGDPKHGIDEVALEPVFYLIKERKSANSLSSKYAKLGCKAVKGVTGWLAELWDVTMSIRGDL